MTSGDSGAQYAKKYMKIEFFKIIFLQEKKIFFETDFFSDSENVSTSQIYAQSGLGVTLSRSTHRFMKKLTVTNFLLEGLSHVSAKVSIR